MHKISPINILNHSEDFFKNTLWSLLDTVAVQAILIIHNIFLQKLIGLNFHGLLSSILGVFYILIIIANFGLDYTLPFFINLYAKDKKNLIRFLKITASSQAALVLTLALLATFLLILFNKFEILDNITILIISATFILESLRKTLRTFLQLVLSSKITALTEATVTYIYIAILWICYLLNFNITIKYCFILLFLASLVQNILLAYAFYKYYLSIPDNTHNSDSRLNYDLDNKMLQTRAYNMLTQLSSQSFNSNFLIPIFSLYLSLDKVSNLKLCFSIVQFIGLIIIKNLSVFLNTLFLYKREYYEKLYQKISKLIYYILCFVMLFLIINSINTSFNFIIFLTVFIEPFLVFYEKIFILEKQSIYIAILNLISILSGIFLIYNYKQDYFDLYRLITYIFVIRIFNMIALSLICLKKNKRSYKCKS